MSVCVCNESLIVSCLHTYACYCGNVNIIGKRLINVYVCIIIHTYQVVDQVFHVSLQSVSRGSPNMPHHYFMPRPGPPFVPNPPPLGAVSANYMPMHGPPPGHMSYFPPPPQPR